MNVFNPKIFVIELCTIPNLKCRFWANILHNWQMKIIFWTISD